MDSLWEKLNTYLPFQLPHDTEHVIELTNNNGVIDSTPAVCPYCIRGGSVPPSQNSDTSVGETTRKQAQYFENGKVLVSKLAFKNVRDVEGHGYIEIPEETSVNQRRSVRRSNSRRGKQHHEIQNVSSDTTLYDLQLNIFQDLNIELNRQLLMIDGEELKGDGMTTLRALGIANLARVKVVELPVSKAREDMPSGIQVQDRMYAKQASPEKGFSGTLLSGQKRVADDDADGLEEVVLVTSPPPTSDDEVVATPPRKLRKSSADDGVHDENEEMSVELESTVPMVDEELVPIQDAPGSSPKRSRRGKQKEDV